MNFNFFSKKDNKNKVSHPEIDKTTSFVLRYSYEWKEEVPENERDSATHPSREFCKELMRLDRFYSRADIEQMSAMLGYSVFDRCGGEGCRHRWVSTVVIKK